MVGAVDTRARAALVWGGLAALVIVLFVATVCILNATLYSAGGFVRGYVDALNRGDAAGALTLAGVQPTTAAGDELLGISERGMLDHVHETADDVLPDGSHRIGLGFTVKGDRTPHTSVFTVRSAGTRALLFDSWRFATPPTAALDVTPLHDRRFTVDGSQVTSPAADLATRYTVLAPAVLDLAHDTTYLTAPRTRVVVDTVGGEVAQTIDVEPRAAFTAQVRVDVDRFLKTSCLPQQVLLPAGCPFGEQVDDRLTSDPAWTMTDYPEVTLTPTTTPGVWRVVKAAGLAHLEVEAQSLYDGHSYAIDKDVPFDFTYLVTIGPDNGLTIKPE
ncbi:hypothetical protein [Frondihabitans cladoniiphilus]|uniref:Uncharacterized protein n=1 Tax=Frondihabitans cladoniiphilus TaxID=715785 RepID=A0ABP8WAR1_9MICO